jgi:hypothetical protein
MRFAIPSALTLLAASGALACSDSTAPAAGSSPISVSFTTNATAGASLMRSADLTASSELSATVGADALVITKAQLVLARIELQRVGATCASELAAGDDERDDHDCEELELAPMLVDLPVNGTVVNAINVTIPEGTYSSLEAKLRPVRAGNDRGRGSSAFLAAHPELSGVSVLVEGTFNGQAFTFTSPVSAGIEHSFSPPLTVSSSPLNFTVNVDLSNWFRKSGALIDPRTANAGGANERTVADNIRQSFRAFRDDDHNGHDDDGEGHR